MDITKVRDLRYVLRTIKHNRLDSFVSNLDVAEAEYVLWLLYNRDSILETQHKIVDELFPV